MARDMSEAQFADALQRNGFLICAKGPMLLLLRDDRIDHTFGTFGSAWWARTPRRQRLAWCLEKRDGEEQARNRRKKHVDTAATLGVDPDTGALLFEPLGRLA